MITDIMDKEINKINDQIKKLEEKRNKLIIEKSEYIEYLENKDKKIIDTSEPEEIKKDVINHVGFCLFKATGESNRRDDVTWYNLNKNPNVSTEVPLILKQSKNVFILNDGRSDNERKIMEDFAREYNIKIIGE